MQQEQEREASLAALQQEREVTEQIKGLTALAREEQELIGEEFLRWFLREQLEETSSMADLLRIVQRAAESNLLLAEDYLARSQVGDHGSDPLAPTAAGGTL